MKWRMRFIIATKSYIHLLMAMVDRVACCGGRWLKEAAWAFFTNGIIKAWRMGDNMKYRNPFSQVLRGMKMQVKQGHRADVPECVDCMGTGLADNGKKCLECRGTGVER